MIRSRWWLLGLAGVGVFIVAALVATGAPAAELAVGASAVVGYSALFLVLRPAAAWWRAARGRSC